MNKIKTKIISIQKEDSINLVKLESNNITLSLLTLDLPNNIKVESEVMALFKESEVAIAKSECEISISNRIKGEIIDIENGKIVTMVKIKTKIGEIDSMITTASSERMNLKVGEIVFALVKSNEMSLEVIE